MGIGTQGARQIAEAVIENGRRLDGIAAILLDIKTALEQGGGGGDRVKVFGQVKQVMEMLLACGLHPAPRLTRPITVPTTAVVLAENQSEPYMIVKITNDNPVKELWVGPAGLTTANGSVIMPQASEWYVMAPTQKIYGVCALTTVSARVSIGTDMMRAITTGFG